METINSNISVENNRYANYLENITRYISIYTYLFYLIVGNIGVPFKILFFLQKPVRTCPCSIYIIAATISDFITINNIPIFTLLSSLYSSKTWISIITIRPSLPITINEDLIISQASIRMCKILNYLHMWSTDISIHFLLFASINRYFTGLKKLKRSINTQLKYLFCVYTNSIKISLGSCIIWAFISLHHYFNFTVISNFCMPKHYTLWAVWIFDVHCIIPSMSIIILIILTIINVRKRSSSFYRQSGTDKRRVFNVRQQRQNSCYNRSTHHRIERQLTLMTITETIGTILTTLPYAVYVMYRALRVENEKSVESEAREDLIEQSIRLTMYFEPSCGFYFYLFTLTTLRKRFVRILLNKIRRF